MMEAFAEYRHAIVSIAAVALLGLLMNPIPAIKKTGRGMAAGATPEGDYSDPVYRWNRAYLNLTEMMGLFVGVTVAAILAGASPWWVNLFASVYLLSRLAVAVVHIAGIGPMNMGPRTLIFVLGWAACIALAVMAIAAVL